MNQKNKNNLNDDLIAIDLNEEDLEDSIDCDSDEDDFLDLPINGSPVYPHIYVGQSGIPDMVDFNESGYRGDNYLMWHNIFPDISAGSIYG
jgi:hypothetical protein